MITAYSCAPVVEEQEIKKDMEEFREFLELVPMPTVEKDSLVQVAATMDSMGRKGLITKLDSKYAEAIALHREREARNLRIRNQFNPRTRAHFKVQQSVQESMNDPSGFEHVSTSYTEHPDHLMIDMHFRMPVSRGVTMMHRIVAKVDLEGNVLDGEITRIRE